MYPAGYRESKEWLAQNREFMIDCPKQPGNLWISKNACGKRHKASLNPDRRIYSEDSFGYALRQGLSLCGTAVLASRWQPPERGFILALSPASGGFPDRRHPKKSCGGSLLLSIGCV